MRVTVLGCAGSTGVPMIGGRWGRCDPNNPKNRRSRPSVFVAWDGLDILIDTSPDLRQQLLAAEVTRVDVVLYTHGHADHVHGIDDLRSLWRLNGAPIEVYAEPAVLAEILARFRYLFDGARNAEPGYPPFLVPRAIEGPVDVAGRRIDPFVQDHGVGPSTGFRLGRFAYSTDVVALPEESLALLAGIDTWVVDCLRIAPAHPTHAHLAVTLEWIRRVRPRRAVLTHMNHQADYAELRRALPPGVEPAYDGMVLEVPG